jgi:hypothetical protein
MPIKGGAARHARRKIRLPQAVGLDMTIADRIQTLGFKRWYERALLESHAYLVTSFLGLILVFAGIEMIGNHVDMARSALGVVASAVGTAAVTFGLRRYHRLMVLATNLSERATCPRCGKYAAFTLIASGKLDTTAGADHISSVWLKVRCRQCGTEWTI